MKCHYARGMGHRFIAVVILVGVGVTVAGCAGEDVDPLAVTNSASITDIRDNTNTGWYTVDSADLATNGLGTELTLGFTITNANHTEFNPVSTITFSDGTVLTCEADDLRRVPSLQESTDTWDFACDADEFPEDADGSYIEIVDTYN